MVTFEYHARDNVGEVREGVIEANSQEGAVDTLHRAGLIVVGIREKTLPFFFAFLGRGKNKAKRSCDFFSPACHAF